MQAGQQERTKPALVAIYLDEIIFLEHAGEEALRQIFGIFDVITPAPNIRIHRIPISAAEPFHGCIGGRRRVLAGGQHHAPLRCEKQFGLGRLGSHIGYHLSFGCPKIRQSETSRSPRSLNRKDVFIRPYRPRSSLLWRYCCRQEAVADGLSPSFFRSRACET